MTEAEKIADKLTEAQRRFVLAMNAEHPVILSAYGRSFCQLEEQGVATRHARHRRRGVVLAGRLTPLGREVRKVLSTRTNGGGHA